MRTMSQAFRAALMAENADDDGVCLITIEHALLPVPIRISSHATQCFSVDPLRYGTASRGEVYDYLEHQITLPEDADGTPPAFEVQIANIGREMVELIQSTNEPAVVTVEIVSRQTPDLVEIVWPDFDLVSAEHDQDLVTIGLAVDAMATEPYPCDDFTPGSFRALF